MCSTASYFFTSVHHIKFGVEEILRDQSSLWTLPFEGMDSESDCNFDFAYWRESVFFSSIARRYHRNSRKNLVKKSAESLLRIVDSVLVANCAHFATHLEKSLWCASTGCGASARRVMTASFSISTTWRTCPNAISTPILVSPVVSRCMLKSILVPLSRWCGLDHVLF